MDYQKTKPLGMTSKVRATGYGHVIYYYIL